MLALLARASRDETRLDSGKVSRQADYYCVFHFHFLSRLGWVGLAPDISIHQRPFYNDFLTAEIYQPHNENNYLK